jgi:hypothetical protein
VGGIDLLRIPAALTQAFEMVGAVLLAKVEAEATGQGGFAHVGVIVEEENQLSHVDPVHIRETDIS